MKKQAQYRLTKIVTTDYGTTKRSVGHFARLPDGTHWGLMPPTLEIELPESAKLGEVYWFKIEPAV